MQKIKNKKNEIPTKQNLQVKNLSLNWLTLSDLFICLTIVCFLFIPTLSRPWLIYDERIISDGIYFPHANSFLEIISIFLHHPLQSTFAISCFVCYFKYQSLKQDWVWVKTLKIFKNFNEKLRKKWFSLFSKSKNNSSINLIY